MLLFGRIVADNDEKMSERSVLLESSRAMGSGVRIPLDLGQCPAYALFPGQLVCLEGRNPDGTAFIVAEQKNIWAPPPPPPAATAAGAASLLIASGPYCLDGALDFAPLDALLLLALERQPDVLVLLGPFVDAENSAVQAGTLDALPEAALRPLVSKLQVLLQRAPHTRLALVPSLQELGHDHVFPQCAYQPGLLGDLARAPNVLLLPNPGLLAVNGTTVALSSLDALLPLGLAEVARSPPGPDRISRLCGHLLQQQSFYPLVPAPAGANIDYTRLEALDMPGPPDLLVVPSALRHFARAVGDHAVVLNPGPYCRKQALGSAAFVSISAPAAGVPAGFAARCRVDTIQF